MASFLLQNRRRGALGGPGGAPRLADRNRSRAGSGGRAGRWEGARGGRWRERTLRAEGTPRLTGAEG